MKGIPNAYVMQENNTNTSGYLVEVLNCTLTLEDITFDGNRYYQLKGKYATAIRGDWSDGQKAQIVVKSGPCSAISTMCHLCLWARSLPSRTARL